MNKVIAFHATKGNHWTLLVTVKRDLFKLLTVKYL